MSIEIRDLIEKVGVPLIHRFMIQRYQLKVCGFISQEFVNALAKKGIEAHVVDTGKHATALVTLPSGTWNVDLSYAQFLCDIDEDSEVAAMMDKIEADPWETIRYSLVPSGKRATSIVATKGLSGYTAGMNPFNEPYAASEASLLRANTSQKGYRYDYDPGVHHARFSNANMKAWGTIVYEDSFEYYNEGKCFLFISSDKAGSGRKFTIFSTCDGGYSLTKVDQVDTKAQATRVVKEALKQASTTQTAEGIVGYRVIVRNPRDGIVAVTDILTKSEAEEEYETLVEVNETDESYSIESVDVTGKHIQVIASKSQALEGWMDKFFGDRNKGQKIVGYKVVARNPVDGIVAVTSLLTKSKAEKQYQTWLEKGVNEEALEFYNEGKTNKTGENYSIEAVDADGFHRVLD